jgi:hypothetical protein
MLALQNRSQSAALLDVAALPASLNPDAEKYLGIENSSKCQKSTWTFSGCCVALPIFTRAGMTAARRDNSPGQ